MKCFKFLGILWLLFITSEISAQKTEDYAIMQQVRVGSKTVLFISIGEEPVEIVNLEAEKDQKIHLGTGLITQMRRLNNMGYELQGTTAILAGNFPEYTYVFVKELNP